MGPATIQSICTALELELSFVKNELTPEFIELIKNVKANIKEIENKYSLDNNYFSQIKGSMSHWGRSLFDQITNVLPIYQEELSHLRIPYSHINKNRIREFVKFRNDITHGKHRVLNHDIAETSYFMGALVYCSFLKRMGLQSNEIVDLCFSKIMS